jgi:DNA-binding NtrC family response regulator
MSVKHLLIVEPDLAFRTFLQRMVEGRAAVETAADFPTARARLFATLLDLVVTNLRLGAFNGLHLAYLVASTGSPPRVVVYTNRFDPLLAREGQRAGAFCELQQRMPYALPSYLDANLPPLDRRAPLTPDRRSSYRGGRRAADIAGLERDNIVGRQGGDRYGS